MKWKKLGQIFEFEKSPFKDRFISHAQLPQALEFDNFVRIYFTSRTLDKYGKYLSHPQYVDYTKDFSEIIGYSNHEVFPLGKLGCFDEHGVYPLSPLRYNDDIYAYTSGWTRKFSVDTDSGIGFAISKDNGKTFERLGDGPILSTSLYEPFLVCTPFVRVFENKFYMFYIFGTRWSEATETESPQRLYKIGFATSDDGINWTKANRQIIADAIGTDECQAFPTVIKIGSRYHMYFSYRDMFGFRTEKGKGYRLGYAYSDDLINWTRDDEKAGICLSESGWDSEMMCYPNAFKMNDKIYLLYNGNNFGKDGFGLAVLEDF